MDFQKIVCQIRKQISFCFSSSLRAGSKNQKLVVQHQVAALTTPKRVRSIKSWKKIGSLKEKLKITEYIIFM